MNSISCPNCSHSFAVDTTVSVVDAPPREDLAARLGAVGHARDPRVRDSMTADMAFAQRFARWLDAEGLWSGELRSAELWALFVPWSAARVANVGHVPTMTQRRLMSALLRLGAEWRRANGRVYSIGSAAD